MSKRLPNLSRYLRARVISGGGLLLAGTLRAANFTAGEEPTPLFGVHELVFAGRAEAADPFAVAATVTFTPPAGAGRAQTVDMFWDGGRTWRARAYVNATGAWHWVSACATDAGLNGQRGTFAAAPSPLRGKLRPHPSNPRALVTDNGQWFAPLGDTAYFLLGSPAYQEYVRDDWACGINFLRCSAFGQLRSYAAHFTAPGSAAMPKLASLQADDAKLQWLFENYPGIYLQYIILPEQNAGRWTDYAAPARERLLQQMVARYGAFPTITWQVMNDAVYPADATGATAVAEAVGAFLLQHDIVGHLRGTGASRGQGAPFAGAAWTTWLHLETLDAVAADEADRLAAHRKFTWCGEDRYETYRPPAQPRYFFRRLMWAWLLSGGGACYGGDWKTIRPYRRAGLAGLDSVRHIRGYFERRQIDLGLFAYDDGLASDPLATGTDRPQACRRGAAEFIVYHPNGTGSGAAMNVHTARTAAFQLDLSAARGPFAVEWFRCLDGATQDGGTVPGGAVRTLTAPWAGQDVVCRLTGATTRGSDH